MIETKDANILILIYNPDVKGYVTTLLEGEGYKIYECVEHKYLLGDLVDKKIDILILDYKDTDTVEICKKIRANFILRHIPIIVLIDKEYTIEKIKCIY